MGCAASNVEPSTLYLGDDKGRSYTKGGSTRGTNGKAGIRAEETEEDEHAEVEQETSPAKSREENGGKLDRNNRQEKQVKKQAEKEKQTKKGKQPGSPKRQKLNKRQDKNKIEEYEAEETPKRSVNFYAPDRREPDKRRQEPRDTDPRSPMDVDDEEETPDEGPTEEELRIAALTKQLQRRVNRLCDSDRHGDVEYSRIRTTADILKTYYNACGMKYHFDTKRQEEFLKQVHKAKQEKTQLLHRMSEIAGAALKFNNPAIADLSDENRATKLAEKASQLYDNEWTDTFEGTRDKLPPDVEDSQIVESLRNILQFCYQLCEQKAISQRASMYDSLGLNGPKDDTNTNLRIKELQKKSASYSLPKITEGVKQEMIQKHKLKHKPVLSPVLDVLTTNIAPLREYVDRCVNICWYMQMQEPAVAMQFEPGTDNSVYRQYTQSGPIVDYVVWPVLFLHKGGPLLSRGVAQFKHEDNCTCQTHKKEKERKQEQKDIFSADNVTTDQNVNQIDKDESDTEKTDKSDKLDTTTVDQTTSKTVSDGKDSKTADDSKQSGSLDVSMAIQEGQKLKETEATSGKVAAEFNKLGKRRREDKRERSQLSDW